MGTRHSLGVGSFNHAITANPNATGASYANIAARDADSDFNTTATNINKVVRVESPLAFFLLAAIAPTWVEFGAANTTLWTALTDTPSSISANLSVEGNAAGTALVFGQNLKTTGSPTFAVVNTTDNYQLGGTTILFEDATNFNLSVGLGAGVSHTTGIQNVAVGTNALAVNTVGDLNTAVGYLAMNVNVSGDDNAAFGAGSLLFNVDGLANTAIGTGALRDNTSGSTNTAVGFQSLLSNTTGVNNVAVGASALVFNNAGARNTVLGDQAGGDVLGVTNTGDNTFIGYNTGRGIITGVQNTILGANVIGLAAALSNNIILADGAGVVRLQFDSSGDGTIGGALTISGDLTVQGTTTTLDTTTLLVEDKNIELGVVATPTDVTADGGGITLKGTTDKTITWINSNDSWEFNQDIRITSALAQISVINITSPESGDDLNLTSFNDMFLNSSGVIRLDSVGTITLNPTTAIVSVGTSRITDVVDPTGAQDAATKNYVDTTGGNVSNTGTPLDNQLAIWTDANTIEGDGDLTFDGSSLAIGGSAPLTDLTIFQNATIALKGFTLSGPGAASGSQTTDGANICVGVNSTANMQLWFTQHSDIGNSTKNAIRFILGKDLPQITAISANGAVGKSISLGDNTAGNVGVGFAFSSVQTDILAKLHVQNTTEQFRLSFDVSNFASFTVDSGGDLTIAPSGSDVIITSDLTVLGNQVSRLPTTVNQLFSTADYEALGTASVITTTGTRSLRFNASVTSTTRHTVSGQSAELQFIDPTEGNQMIYIGSATFITAATGGDITSRNGALIAGIAGTQLFDYLGEGKLPGVDIIEIVQSSNLAQWDLGTVGRVSTGEFGPIIRFKDTNIISTTDPLILDSCPVIEMTSLLFDDTAEVGSGGPLFSIKTSNFKEGRAVFLTNGGQLYSGESLVRIDAGLPNTYRVQVIDSLLILRSGASIFDTSGATGTFTAVADSSISATAITGVTDSSGVASFTHAGTTPPVGSLVTVSGFTTNTDYNTTGIVSASSATTFEIDYVAFGTSETGSYLSDAVTITATAHGLTLGTGVTLDTTESTSYDGGFLIYNIQTNSFDIQSAFAATEAGTWSTEGLDQTDPRVIARNNPGQADSHAILCAHVNDNSTANGAIVNNTFTDMVFGTGGSALIESSTTERGKLINELNGTFEYTGLDPFDGLITFDFTVESSGGTVDFRFKWQISTDGGATFVDLLDTVESLVAVGSDAQSVTKTFPLAMSKGDQIKPQITRNSGSSGITATYATIYATNS